MGGIIVLNSKIEKSKGKIMVVIMSAGITPADSRVKAVSEKASAYGLRPEVGEEKGTKYGLVQIFLHDGEKVQSCSIPDHIFRAMPGVENVQRVTPPRVSIFHKGNGDHHQIQIGGVRIGTGLPTRLVFGPCTVDQHIGKIVEALAEKGIRKIRGGCWKPRSKPYSFPGFGEKALVWLLKAAARNATEVVFTEVIESHHIDAVRRARDKTHYYGTIVLWKGARTMNSELLRALGRQTEFPVMLKNSIDAQGVDDLYEQAEWVLTGNTRWCEDGSIDRKASTRKINDKVILCLRGVKKTDSHSRMRFKPNHDWLEILRDECWAPVGIDPSHSAGTNSGGLVMRNIAAALAFDPALIMVEGGYPKDGYNGFRGHCDVDQSIPMEEVGKVIAMIEAHNMTHHPQVGNSSRKIPSSGRTF